MIREHVQDLQEMARGYSEAESANQELAGTLASDVVL